MTMLYVRTRVDSIVGRREENRIVAQHNNLHRQARHPTIITSIVKEVSMLMTRVIFK